MNEPELQSPHAAGAVPPSMEATYSGEVTVTLTATARVPFTCMARGRANAERQAEQRAADLLDQYKGDSRNSWAGTEDWDFEIHVEGGE